MGLVAVLAFNLLELTQAQWQVALGNRAAAIVGEPGNPLVVYIGAASGGIWKTTDGGTRWKPVFDDQDVSAFTSEDPFMKNGVGHYEHYTMLHLKARG